MRSGRSSRTVWLWYLIGGSFLTYLYALVPPFHQSGPLINLLGFSSSVAIVVGIRLHRPRAVLAWSLFVVGQLLFFLGDLYTYSYRTVFHADVPFPSIGDALYLTVYPALMVGLLVIVRRRNPRSDRAGVIDSMILTVGVALLSFVFIISPYIHLDGLDWLAKSVSIAYPVGDILLLAAAIRLSVDRGTRKPAFYLLVGSIVCLLATDSVYTKMLLINTYNHQMFLDVGWIYYYLLWGAAALHPSMRTLEQPAEGRTRLTPVRLAFLTVACLIAPVIRLEKEWHDSDTVVVIAASIVMFVLVLARMAGLVRQEERAVLRQRALRRAGVALVGAASIDHIEDAAADAVRELAGADADVRLVSFHEDFPDDDEVSPAVQAWLTDQAGEDSKAVQWVDIPANLRQQLGLAGEASHVLLALAGRAAGSTFLIVSIPGKPGAEMSGALEALAAQVSLAIDGALLAEDLHRRRSEARFRSLVAHSSDLIAVLDRSGTVVYQSPSIEEVLGYTVDEVVNTRFELLVRSGDRARLMQVVEASKASVGGSGMVECSLRSRAGDWLQFEIRHTNLLNDEHVQGIVLNCRDISERKLFEDQLAHQAFHDPVTGLANRALFADRVQHALARASREQSTVGVIFHRSRRLQDDQRQPRPRRRATPSCRRCRDRMRAAVRPTDTVARFGGDEFAVLVEEVQRSQEAVDVAERVLEALNAPIDTGRKELFVGASVGLCLTSGEHMDAADLLRNADVAMYMAKRERQGQLSRVRAGDAPRGASSGSSCAPTCSAPSRPASSRCTTSR